MKNLILLHECLALQSNIHQGLKRQYFGMHIIMIDMYHQASQCGINDFCYFGMKLSVRRILLLKECIDFDGLSKFHQQIFLRIIKAFIIQSYR